MSTMIRGLARSRPAWFFAAAWLASAIVLVATGQGFPVQAALIGLVYLGLSAVTVLVTDPGPSRPLAPRDRPRAWLRLAIAIAFVLLTGSMGLAFHGVIAADAIPLWSDVVASLAAFGEAWFGNGNLVTNPVLYFVAPAVLLALAGASRRELGLRRGEQVWRVLVLWSTIPVAILGFAVATGQLTIERLGGRLVSHALQNGFFEEFLFRGALQGILRRLIDPGWALVLQALAFGAWHLGLGFANTDGAGLLPALASVIAYQAVIGLAFGVILERTRNLLVPSVAHVLANSVG